jgi:hypothetical protein
MAEDEAYFRDGPTITVAKAVVIVELCQRAGQPQRIVEFLRSGYSIDDVRDTLYAPAAAGRSESAPVDERLADVIRKRFEAQNPNGPAKLS